MNSASIRNAILFTRSLASERVLDLCRFRNVVTVYSNNPARVFPAHDATVVIRRCDDDVTVYTFTF